MSIKRVYHYTVRYTYIDKKKQENGYGRLDYATTVKIEDSPFNLVEWLEREIALNRKHESVFISCFSLYKINIMS